ncbi:MAG: hypothetical protein GX131_19135 [candidate division WS1 bacterium]|jgi:hypothetical protein|nr:hypothetical protein [candidate division WS1 bacterium]
MSDQKRDAWARWLHCERVSRSEDWDSNGFCCPQAGCDGGPLDGWQCSRIREANPSYPETPQDGERHPLYPD